MTSLWPTWLRSMLGLVDPDTEFERREAEADLVRFLAEMRARGFVEWLYFPPIGHDVVECRRLSWRNTEIIRPAECSPFMNIAGLYWRDVGGVIDMDGEGMCMTHIPPLIKGGGGG